MTGRIQPLRLAASFVVGIGLAAIAGLHAASSVATRQAPGVAENLFFANAEARELVAFEKFTTQVRDPASLPGAAASVRNLSLDAFRLDPTSAKALTLLALAKEDVADRHAAAKAASRINRRDITLQGLVLEAHLAAADFNAVVETLDQILRVHPSYLPEFAPVLAQAMGKGNTLPVIARLLDGSSLWHRHFFSVHALANPSLLPKLALLRAERPLVDDKFDRELIRRMVHEGYRAEARNLYETLSGGQETISRGTYSGSSEIPWEARFPPFDWKFASDNDFRAQESIDGDELEIFARPGRGGIIAERVLAMPSSAFTLNTRLELGGAQRSDAVRAELSCGAGGDPFAVRELGLSENAIRVTKPPACEELVIAVHARSWSGGSALRARLGKFSISGAR